ncbi:hypothetical protein [Vibrio mytili]|uniref:Uncharacterized protein n=1 Tax=Vibrio mytili TaxID=50718 RepID=A0A0C3IBV2_9VIBR|nr:hypothetical protein [Vibrio mytili]KIN11787.1 hypothetical protein SU60_04455 [Vibrio mytili]
MPVSGLQSGHQLIQLSQQMADKASEQINHNASKPSQDLAFNKVESMPEQDSGLSSSGIQPAYNSHSSLTEPLLNLTQAASYNRIGASVVDKNNEVIGTLLDIHV